VYDNVDMILSMDSGHTAKALNDLNEKLPERRIFIMRHRSPEPQNIYWSHHDKAVVIDANMVFWGGLDACFGRWDYHVHPLADVHPRTDEELWVGQDYNNARIMDFVKVRDWSKEMLPRGE
jgi:phospholipase D1/2